MSVITLSVIIKLSVVTAFRQTIMLWNTPAKRIYMYHYQSINKSNYNPSTTLDCCRQISL